MYIIELLRVRLQSHSSLTCKENLGHLVVCISQWLSMVVRECQLGRVMDETTLRLQRLFGSNGLSFWFYSDTLNPFILRQVELDPSTTQDAVTLPLHCMMINKHNPQPMPRSCDPRATTTLLLHNSIQVPARVAWGTKSVTSSQSSRAPSIRSSSRKWSPPRLLRPPPPAEVGAMGPDFAGDNAGR